VEAWRLPAGDSGVSIDEMACRLMAGAAALAAMELGRKVKGAILEQVGSTRAVSGLNHPLLAKVPATWKSPTAVGAADILPRRWANSRCATCPALARRRETLE